MPSTEDLDQNQTQQNIPPNLDPNCLTLWLYSWKNSSKIDFEKKLVDEKKA